MLHKGNVLSIIQYIYCEKIQFVVERFFEGMWMKKKASPKSSRSKKVEKLDTIFSKFIRRRDCGYGYGRCISCSKPIRFDTCDAGHYINRKHMAVRYDEKNVHGQCRACNRFDEGNIQGYRKGLIEKIGEKQVDMLEIKRFNTSHLSEVELDLLIDLYRRKLKELEQKAIFLP